MELIPFELADQRTDMLSAPCQENAAPSSTALEIRDASRKPVTFT